MWSAALKEYAKQNGKFIVPKKGSPEYEAVTMIKDKLSKPAPEPEVKAPKKRKEVSPPPPDPELEKKLEEERKLKLELEAKEAAKAARAAKKALKQATIARLNKEREDLLKQEAENAAFRAKAQLTDASMKKLRSRKPSEKEASDMDVAKKVAQQANEGRKVPKTKKTAEPSFRIEDKQIIISFKD